MTSFADELLSILKAETRSDPMYEAVRTGRMTREGLKLWTIQASLVVRQFTRFISAIHSNCPDREAQKILAENLWEEHGCGRSECDHLSLVREMALSLGATEQELGCAEPLPQTADYIECCRQITREGSFVEGMAAVGIGIEYHMPKFFGGMAEALQRHYDLTPDQIRFLLVHVEEDADHAKRSLELVERFADTPELRQRAAEAVRKILAVKQRFAAAIYAQCVGANK